MKRISGDQFAGNRRVSLEVVKEFHNALTTGKAEKVRRVVEAHPEVLRFMNSYGTVLHHAAAESTVEVVEYLLTCGFSVDESDPEIGNTILFSAIVNRDRAMVRWLVERGANVNAGRLHTPLHLAAFYNDDETICYLLDHGADASRVDDDGLTPLGFAIKKGRERAAAVLKERGAPLKGTAPVRVERPTMSIDLPSFAEPIREMIHDAVARYRREHAAEPLAAMALHACAVTGFVSVCFEPGEFEGDVPGMKYAPYETLELSEWREPYEKAGEIVMTLEGGKSVRFKVGKMDDAKLQKPVYQFLVELLKELAAVGAFAALPRKPRFQIGVEMLDGSFGKFWKVKEGESC